MINMFDILLYDGYHSSNVFTFINGSLLNNYIPIFREYFNYCVRSSICFSILFCLKTTYNYFVSCAVLMTYSSLVLLSIIHLKNVLFCCLITLQLVTWHILNITYFLKTNYPWLAFIVVWYVLHIQYAAADSNTVQSNYKSYDSSNRLVCTIFGNVWLIISTI